MIPTLLTWPGSVLVYDLKSENGTKTAGCRSQFSRTIYFNPNDPNSAHFNPLLEVRLGDLEVRDVQNIADMIEDPDGRGMSDHWAKTGHSLLVGTILHVLYSEEEKTLAGVATFLSSPERNIVETLDAMMHAKHSESGLQALLNYLRHRGMPPYFKDRRGMIDIFVASEKDFYRVRQFGGNCQRK